MDHFMNPINKELVLREGSRVTNEAPMSKQMNTNHPYSLEIRTNSRDFIHTNQMHSPFTMAGSPASKKQHMQMFHFNSSDLDEINSKRGIFNDYGSPQGLDSPGLSTAENLGSKLHYISLIGDKQAVNNILQDGNCKLESKDKWGRSALFSAVLGNFEEIVQLLLKAGSKPDAVDYYKKTPLHYASYMGHIGCMKLLIQAIKERGSVWLVEDDCKATPLHYSVIHRHSKCLQQLLKYSDPSMIDILDYKKRTPLHWASASGSEENIKILLKHGANALLADKEGKIPLHWAVISNTSSTSVCIQAIVTAASSSINWQDFEGVSPLHLAVVVGLPEVIATILSVKSINVDLADNQYRTALHWACNMGLVSIVSKLIDSGANLSATDNVGATPLHYAASNNYSSTVELLVRHPNVGEDKTKDGLTPLLWASLKGSNDVLTVMVRHGASLDQCDPQGWSALHMAARMGHTSTTATLIRLNADIHAVNNVGQTPLLMAAQGGHKEIVKLLLKVGASLDHCDNNQRCALHHSVMNGQLLLTTIIINAGVSPNTKDVYGRTPLHMAACHGWLEIMSVLLENGADINARDNQGLTALHWAAEGKIAAVNILLSYKANPNFISFTQDRFTPLNAAFSSQQFENAKVLSQAGGLTTFIIETIAATRIQAVCKGYLVRKKIARGFKKRGRGRGHYRRLSKNSHRLLHSNNVLKSDHNINKEEEKVNRKQMIKDIETDDVNEQVVETQSTEEPSVSVVQKDYTRSTVKTSKQNAISLLKASQRKTERKLSLPLPEQLGLEKELRDINITSDNSNQDSDDYYDILNEANKGPSNMMTNALKQPSVIANAVVTTGAPKQTDNVDKNQDLKSTENQKTPENVDNNENRCPGDTIGTQIGATVGENAISKETKIKTKGQLEWEKKRSSFELYYFSPKNIGADGTPFSYNLTKHHKSLKQRGIKKTSFNPNS